MLPARRQGSGRKHNPQSLPGWFMTLLFARTFDILYYTHSFIYTTWVVCTQIELLRRRGRCTSSWGTAHPTTTYNTNSTSHLSASNPHRNLSGFVGLDGLWQLFTIIAIIIIVTIIGAISAPMTTTKLDPVPENSVPGRLFRRRVRRGSGCLRFGRGLLA